MKIQRIIKIIGFVLCSILSIFFVWFTAIGGTAYIYAGYLEEKWIAANPTTKEELEQHISFYSLHQIEPKESMWGNRYLLQGEERMMQYQILWHKYCPLEVVYDQNDNIKHIFTSYE